MRRQRPARGELPAAMIAALREPKDVGIALGLGVVAASAALAMPASLLPLGLVLGTMLVALAAYDLAAFRLPDLLTLPLILTGLAASFVLPDADPAAHVIGAALGLLVPLAIAGGYHRWRGVEGLGLGDVKLLGAGGAWLGWQAIPSVLLLAASAGILWFAWLRARGRTDVAIPFGVPLAGAIWWVWLMGSIGF